MLAIAQLIAKSKITLKEIYGYLNFKNSDDSSKRVFNEDGTNFLRFMVDSQSSFSRVEIRVHGGDITKVDKSNLKDLIENKTEKTFELTQNKMDLETLKVCLDAALVNLQKANEAGDDDESSWTLDYDFSQD